MRLRPVTLVVTFVIGLLAGPLPAEAQQAGKVYRVGWLRSSPRPSTKRWQNDLTRNLASVWKTSSLFS